MFYMCKRTKEGCDRGNKDGTQFIANKSAKYALLTRLSSYVWYKNKKQI